ncbi:MAG: HAD family hydrolase [Firmicutes bacterium HGW-Firmicutes-1]|jgi:phosphoglycolate phosphatase|nr:MAG: HAD family hydrolase [Firmicutes bacterium HGW-Firmicutes-1]
MKENNTIKTIFLDYDGTIHDSIQIYAPSFRMAYDFLIDQGLVEKREWTNQEISRWMGFSSKEMWEQFMPHLDEEIQKKASKIVGEEIINQIKQGNAKLFDGALETLEYLKSKGYVLIFISNCNSYYKEIHKSTFQLDRYFTELVGSEEFNYIPKSSIMEIVMQKYESDMCMIGDRLQDMSAGRMNGLKTFGCLYGYGSQSELEDADIKINSITELKKYF